MPPPHYAARLPRHLSCIVGVLSRSDSKHMTTLPPTLYRQPPPLAGADCIHSHSFSFALSLSHVTLSLCFTALSLCYTSLSPCFTSLSLLHSVSLCFTASLSAFHSFTRAKMLLSAAMLQRYHIIHAPQIHIQKFIFWSCVHTRWHAARLARWCCSRQ